MNEGIDRHLCSLQFASVDSAARIVARLGRGAFQAKVDIVRAYHDVLVHPVDRQLLGMVRDDHFYIDTALPFGLRSAPKSFARSQMLWNGCLSSEIFHPACTTSTTSRQ